MIRSVLSLAFAFSVLNVSAQHYLQVLPPVPVLSGTALPTAWDKAGELIINYDATDEILKGAGSYQRAIWPLNAAYASLPQDSMLTYGIIAFDSIVDQSGTYSFPMSSLGTITIDSIWIRLGHRNLSGAADTLIVQAIALDTSSHPSQNVLWSDTLITVTDLSPGGNWQNTVNISFGPQLLLAPAIPFGIRFAYHGALQDTLGVAAGYGTDGNCGSLGFSKAVSSAFYPNSYAYWNSWNMLLPSFAGGDIYYDCDGDFQFSGADGRNFIQNWNIAVKVSSPELAAPVQQAPARLRVFPNPASDRLQISSDAGFHRVEVLTLDGRLLLEKDIPLHHDYTADLTTFIPGLYIIRIHGEQFIHAAKINVSR